MTYGTIEEGEENEQRKKERPWNVQTGEFLTNGPTIATVWPTWHAAENLHRAPELQMCQNILLY